MDGLKDCVTSGARDPEYCRDRARGDRQAFSPAGMHKRIEPMKLVYSDLRRYDAYPRNYDVSVGTLRKEAVPHHYSGLHGTW
jgi:hypothetical protein